MIYLYMHENEKARAAFQRARPMVERLIRESPDDASRHLLLAQLLVGSGTSRAGLPKPIVPRNCSPNRATPSMVRR